MRYFTLVTFYDCDMLCLFYLSEKDKDPEKMAAKEKESDSVEEVVVIKESDIESVNTAETIEESSEMEVFD